MNDDKEHYQKLGEKMLETLEMDIKGSELVRAMATGIFRCHCRKIKGNAPNGGLNSAGIFSQSSSRLKNDR